MIYLASPYAHPDPAVMQERYEKMVTIVNRLYTKQLPVYSPIVHNHPVALLGGLPRTWDFWKIFDLDMLSCCEELWIVQLEGWNTSIGVKAEIEHMHDLGKLMCALNPTTLETNRYKLHP